MEPSAGSHGASCAMLAQTRTCRRCIPYATAVLFFVTLWVTQQSQNATTPRAAYIQSKHKPKEVLPLNVHHSVREGTKPAAAFSTTEGKPQEPSTESSSSSVTLTTSDEYSQEFTGDIITVISKGEESFMREREKVYKERRERVKTVCQQLGPAGIYPSVKRSPLQHLRWLTSHRFIMCLNPKVGTSTWATYMLKKARPKMTLPEKFHIIANQVLRPPYRRDSPKALKMMKKFDKLMIVRHPFTRIVSAYNDKISRPLHEYNELRRAIVAEYRPSNNNSSNTSNGPTFEEFARYLVDVIPLNPNHKDVKYIDKHWCPFYLNCAPCNIDYDVIMKLETMNEDTKYVSQRYHLGIQEMLFKNHKSSNTTNTTLAFFKGLPRDITQSLYQRYHVDFLMFDYSVSLYLSSET